MKQRRPYCCQENDGYLTEKEVFNFKEVYIIKSLINLISYEL